MRSVSVAVPVPGIGALTYLVPDHLPDPVVGARLLVPLGKRIVTGVVVEVGDWSVEDGTAAANLPPSTLQPPPSTLHPPSSTLQPPPSTAKPLIDVLDADPFLPASVVRLAAWVADYYAAGIGDAIATAMPPRAWVESERHARITDAGEAHLLRERGARREVLERLSGGRIASVGKARIPHAVLSALEADGLIELTQPLKGAADASRTVRVAVLTVQGSEDLAGLRLGARQAQAVDLLRAAPGGIALADFAREDIPSESIERLAKLGLLTIERRRIERDPFSRATSSYVAQTFRPAQGAGPGSDGAGLKASPTYGPHRRTTGRFRHAGGSRRRAHVSRRAPARRHRERQDGDLSTPRARGP